MAALTSLLEISGALLGGAAGHHLPRLGLQRGLVVAMLCLALGSAGAALAQGLPMAAVARLVESLGYLVTVVAAPVLIALAAPAHRQAAAMTLWGTFVPVGMAVGAAAYAFAAGLSDWRWAQGAEGWRPVRPPKPCCGSKPRESRVGQAVLNSQR